MVSHHEDEQARKKFWDEFWEVLAPLNVFVCELKVSLSWALRMPRAMGPAGEAKGVCIPAVLKHWSRQCQKAALLVQVCCDELMGTLYIFVVRPSF